MHFKELEIIDIQNYEVLRLFQFECGPAMQKVAIPFLKSRRCQKLKSREETKIKIRDCQENN